MRWLPLKEAAKALGMKWETLKSKGQRGQWERVKQDGTWHYQVGSESIAPNVDDWDPLLLEAAPKGEVHTAIVIADAHHPTCDVATWNATCKLIKEVQPDEIILLGDFLELESCSQHSRFVQQAFLDDMASGKAAIAALRRKAPAAKITYIEGNHETRLRRFTQSVAPTLKGALTLPEQLDLASANVDWVPRGKLVKRGRLHFTHGDFHNVHHAKKHLDTYGVSVAYGHTHRPQMYISRDGVGRCRAAFGLPCMRSIQPDWLEGKPSGWMHGFGVLYVDDSGDFNLYPVLCLDGKFRWQGRTYDGNS